jgi:hypothetical protein
VVFGIYTCISVGCHFVTLCPSVVRQQVLIGNVDELSVFPHLRRFALLNCIIYCPVVTHYSVLSIADD